MKIDLNFFNRNDPALISRELLGKVLCTNIKGEITSGIIVETEAYQGPEDRGSHAFMNRRTPRTEIMFQAPGNSYVYLCYGIHYLFNVVTAFEGLPHAVLIRAIQPVEGIDIMQRRRGFLKNNYQLTSGPGALAQALGINQDLNGLPVNGNTVWIEQNGSDTYPNKNSVPEFEIIESARVGMNFDGPWHSIPWRFRIKNNPWTSKAK